MDKQEIATKIRFKVQEINELIRNLRELDAFIEVQLSLVGRHKYQAKITEEII